MMGGSRVISGPLPFAPVMVVAPLQMAVTLAGLPCRDNVFEKKLHLCP